MATSAPQGFAALLHSAVHEPGTLSQAYRQFHSYSLGNQLLALFQCHERGIPPGPINTFPGWKALGRHVRKGQKAITLCMPMQRKRTAETTDPDTGEPGTEAAVWTQFIYKPRWFVLCQTDGDPLPEPEILTATAWALRGSGPSRSVHSRPCPSRRASTNSPMCCWGTPPRACRPTPRSCPAASGSAKPSRSPCSAVPRWICPASPRPAATCSAGGAGGRRSPSGRRSGSSRWPIRSSRRGRIRRCAHDDPPIDAGDRSQGNRSATDTST